MTIVYLVCALLGGTVLLWQLAMTLLGMEGHHDVPDDVSGGMDVGHFDHGGGADAHHHSHSGDDPHGSTWLFGVITFRTVVAALTFFGLIGMATTSAELAPVPSFTLALLAGLAAMFGVHFAMQQLYRLRSEGTVRIDRAVGQVGTVYIPIPGQRQGAGKIQINLQNQTVELQASTAGDQLPTGARVIVRALVGTESVEVERAPAPEEVTHA